MGILENSYQASLKAESHFHHKAILFIGSESYDAPTITILQGLDPLGFTIYTIRRPNINSYWCNKVVHDPARIKYDFILSNLHWGTRWDHYGEFKLHNWPKVLIDGDDNSGELDWLAKHRVYSKRYKKMPGPSVYNRKLQPYRWVAPLGNYKPDIVFASQKHLAYSAHYLPFGIHRNYLKLMSGRPTKNRSIDFANIPGKGGTRRKRLTKWLHQISLPGKVHNDFVKGKAKIPKGLEQQVKLDRNIHSYHRWCSHHDYFNLLSNTKILLYPGVNDNAHWDSKRPWEAYASGCLVMFEKPLVDMRQYPVLELCPFATFSSRDELTKKCLYLYECQDELDKLRIQAVEGALKYFVPTSLARYFLWKIGKHLT